MLIYFDSVLAIYLFDHVGSFNARALARLTALEAAGDRIAVSDLVRLECRVLPMRLGDTAKLAVFETLLANATLKAGDRQVASR
jgi:hypothetical protein